VLGRVVVYEAGDDRDVSDWVGLLSRRVEGRVRRRTSLLTDINVTDWRPPTISGMCPFSLYTHVYAWADKWRKM